MTTSSTIAPTVALLLAGLAVAVYPAPATRFAEQRRHPTTLSVWQRAGVAGVAVVLAVLLMRPDAVVTATAMGILAVAASGMAATRAGRGAQLVDRSLLVLVCELWAATVDAGATVATGLGLALGAVRDRSVADPGIRTLTAVHGLLQLGTDPATAWANARNTPELVPLATAAARSSLTGSALAASLREHADQLRRDDATAEHSRAERAGVLMTAPLALCFLPGFICLGLAPVVIALLGSLDLGR